MAKDAICFPGEVWKPVCNSAYAEPLEVSSFARVRRQLRTYPMVRSGRLPYTVTRPLRIANQIIRNGYPAVSVKHHDGTRPFIGVHVIVCEAFMGPPPSAQHEVAHWDGNPLNPGPYNLRWATPLENADDRERHGRTCKGEAQKAAILTDKVVIDIRALFRSGSYPGHTALAAIYGCDRTTIARAVSGQRWKHVA